MNRRLLDLCSHVRTRRQHKIWIRLAYRVLEVEALKEDDSGRDGYLAQEELFAELLQKASKVDMEAVELARGAVGEVQGARGEDRGARVEVIPRVR